MFVRDGQKVSPGARRSQAVTAGAAATSSPACTAASASKATVGGEVFWIDCPVTPIMLIGYTQARSRCPAGSGAEGEHHGSAAAKRPAEPGDTRSGRWPPSTARNSPIPALVRDRRA